MTHPIDKEAELENQLLQAGMSKKFVESYLQGYRAGKSDTEALLTQAKAEAELEGRLDELDSLSYNKQMFGDWQGVIEDRIDQLKSKGGEL